MKTVMMTLTASCATVFVSACGGDTPSANDPAALTGERGRTSSTLTCDHLDRRENRVIAAAIRTLYPTSQGGRTVIAEETAAPDPLSPYLQPPTTAPDRDMGDLAEALADYQRRNVRPGCLEHDLRPRRPYDIVPAADLKAIFGPHGEAPSGAGDDTAGSGGAEMKATAEPTLVPERRDALSELEASWRIFYARFPGANGLTTTTRVGFNRAETFAVLSLTQMSSALAGTSRWVVLVWDDGWYVYDTVPIWVA